jgi:uncharacterized protein (DUF433 family)
MSDLRLIESGIFTIPVAAELLGVSASMVRVWVDGHSGKQDPIIENELGRVDGKLAISFKNLMELQFVAFFARAGIKLPVIRSIMSEARTILNNPHPFATNEVFQTDGKRIVTVIGRKNGIDSIFDLKSKNYELAPIILPSLKRDVVYDPRGNARIWFPRRAAFPNVIVAPVYSFGRPILRDSKIPTKTIAKSYAAEKSAEVVSAMFEITKRRVREAVSFEAALHAQAA